MSMNETKAAELVRLRARVAELEAELEKERAAKSHLRQNASAQAQEARTQGAIVRGILRAVNAPDHDWEAVQTVRDLFTALNFQIATLTAECDALRSAGPIDGLAYAKLAGECGDAVRKLQRVMEWAEKVERVRVAAERIPTYTGASKSVLDTLRLALSSCPPLESVTKEDR